MDAETKTCPLCSETIKSAAKVCPHCRYWQKRWALQNPQVLGYMIAVFYLAAMVVFVAVVEKIFGAKHDFSPYQGEIAILTSNISHRIAGTNHYVTVVGVITNRSEISWEDVNLEAQLFDAAGNLIDVISARGDYGGIPVLAHAEAAFKIETKAAQPMINYAIHKVFVRWGKDASAWP
jgi:hypothetical protein